MTKPIIFVKICCKPLYVIQVVKKILISNFLASTDIKVFGRTCFAVLASDWPRTFFTPRVFLFSISLLFWKHKQMLLLASSRGVARGGHGGAFARTSLICAPPSRFKNI